MAQWADCIWQMMRQFPTAFEINEFFLLELIEMVYVCKFGTFLFNTEGERRRAGVNKKTVSFWSVVNTKPDKYRNAHYKPYSGLIFPETSVRRLWVWEGLFFRDCTSLPPPEDSCPAVELEERLQAQGGQLQALAQTQSLELRCAQLQEQNLLLRKALNQVFNPPSSLLPARLAWVGVAARDWTDGSSLSAAALACVRSRALACVPSLRAPYLTSALRVAILFSALGVVPCDPLLCVPRSLALRALALRALALRALACCALSLHTGHVARAQRRADGGATACRRTHGGAAAAGGQACVIRVVTSNHAGGRGFAWQLVGAA
jgi:hypothetical protein